MPAPTAISKTLIFIKVASLPLCYNFEYCIEQSRQKVNLKADEHSPSLFDVLLYYPILKLNFKKYARATMETPIFSITPEKNPNNKCHDGPLPSIGYWETVTIFHFFHNFISFFGKNFLNGKRRPARLKTIIITNGGNSDDRAAGGRVKLRTIQAKK